MQLKTQKKKKPNISIPTKFSVGQEVIINSACPASQGYQIRNKIGIVAGCAVNDPKLISVRVDDLGIFYIYDSWLTPLSYPQFPSTSFSVGHRVKIGKTDVKGAIISLESDCCVVQFDEDGQQYLIRKEYLSKL